MKNKYLITVCLTLFLITAITAQVLSTRNTEIELTEGNKTTLAEYNITDPETSEWSCDLDNCRFKMYQIMNEGTGNEYLYNLGTHKIARRYCTEVNESNQSSGECLTYVDYT